MALSELLLGDDGDQSVAIDVPEMELKPGDRVQHVYTKNTGTIGDKGKTRCEEYEVPVKWDYRPQHGFIAEAKHHLRLL